MSTEYQSPIEWRGAKIAFDLETGQPTLNLPLPTLSHMQEIEFRNELNQSFEERKMMVFFSIEDGSALFNCSYMFDLEVGPFREIVDDALERALQESERKLGEWHKAANAWLTRLKATP